MTREDLIELAGDDEILFVEGLDEAMLGTVYLEGHGSIVIYDLDVCLKILMARGMSEEMARDTIEAECQDDRSPGFLERPANF